MVRFGLQYARGQFTCLSSISSIERSASLGDELVGMRQWLDGIRHGVPNGVEKRIAQARLRQGVATSP